MKKSLWLIAILFTFLNIKAQITTTSQWAWISGSSGISFSGSYGTLNTPSPSNLPGGRSSRTNWIDQNGDLWMFGGLGNTPTNYGKLNDLWKYNISTNTWTWINGDNTAGNVGIYGVKGIANPGNKPGGREASDGWVDASGLFWLFGGQGYTNNSYGYLNDLWSYDPSTNLWTWVSGDKLTNQASVYQFLGIESATNNPGGRLGAVTWSDNNYLWLFGGQSNNYVRLNDLWKFNLTTKQWTCVQSSGNLPNGKPCIREYSMGWKGLDGNFWLFGGTGYDNNSGLGSFNDLWKYNPATNAWTFVKGEQTVAILATYGTQGIASPDNNPGSRAGQATFTDATGNLWMFGGYGYTIPGRTEGNLNDLWKYSPGTNEWTWVKGDNIDRVESNYGVQGIFTDGNKPGARSSFSAWVDQLGNFWVFGGNGNAALWELKSNSVTLPVTYEYFNILKGKNSVLLQWTVADQTNNKKYEIERSFDGVVYHKIGELPTSSAMVKKYSFTDEKPKEGLNYYRIRQVDLDGKFSVSDTKWVLFEEANMLLIYPNPSSEKIQISSPSQQINKLQILNSKGQLLKQKLFHISVNQTAFFIGDLQKGLYFLVVTYSDGTNFSSAFKKN